MDFDNMTIEELNDYQCRLQQAEVARLNKIAEAKAGGDMKAYEAEKKEIAVVSEDLSEKEISRVIDREYLNFIMTQYDEFKKGFELGYSEVTNQVLMFDEYARNTSDWDIEEWFDRNLSPKDIAKVRAYIAHQTSTWLELHAKQIFGGNRCA